MGSMTDDWTMVVIEDPDGFPDTIASDLERADGRYADSENTRIEYDDAEDTVTLWWRSSNAGKWLYDWLVDTMEHYKTEYVDASAEYRAAWQMHEAVYNEFETGES